MDHVEEESKALESEIEFIIENMSNHLEEKFERSDVRSAYVGIRPLLVMDPDGEQNTSKISRDEKIFESPSGLITIAGGNTTYRKMAEKAIKSGLLLNSKSTTEGLKIHEYIKKE